MRTFEIILIVVNLWSLILNFRQQSKATGLGIAGVNLSVFLIHGIFEGFRYQMFFSYLFVILLTALTLIKVVYKVKTPKALRIIAISLSVLFLGFTAFLAHALPVFTLPKPTGSYDVGIQYFHLVDENRTDPFVDPSEQKRDLMVKIYYPAQSDDTKPFSPYFHSPELLRSFTAFFNLPDFAFDHLSLVRTNSKEDLQLSGNQPSYPVILFSHGAGTSMEVQTSQSEDLASHGYIVVNIDHTYVSAATAFPDTIVSHKEATTDFHTADPAEIITQIMADDSSFVIDQLRELNAGKISSIFKGRLNLDQIGAMGHSVGGAVAYNLAINDDRVKAAVDLDGAVYLTPKESPAKMAPFLMLVSDNYHMQAIQSRSPLMKTLQEMDDGERKITLEIYGSEEAYETAYSKAQQNMIGLTEVLDASGTLFTIEGSDHMKFIDIGLFIGVQRLRESIGIGGKTDPARCLEVTKAVTLAFFDRYLKREEDSLGSLLKTYPELIQVDLN